MTPSSRVREWRGQFWSVSELRDLTEGEEYTYQCSAVHGTHSGADDSEYTYGRKLELRVPPVSPREAAPAEAAKPGRAVRMAVFGDLPEGKAGEDVVQAVGGATERPDVVLHLGDIACNLTDNRHTKGDRFLEMIEPVASRVPYMTVPGDRDDRRAYKAFFEMPTHADPWYSFGLGDANVVMIWTDGFSRIGVHAAETAQRQLAWLQKELARLDTTQERMERRWLIVAGHRPLYCSMDEVACGAEAARLRADLEPMFKEFSVDLYLSAHLHAYERTYPVHNGSVCQAQPGGGPGEAQGAGPPVYCGPVYVVNGDAGVPALQYEALPASWTASRHPGSLGFGEVTIHNATHLQYRQLELDYDVQDEFWLVKGKDPVGVEEEPFIEALTWVAFATSVVGLNMAFVKWSQSDGVLRRDKALRHLRSELEVLGVPPELLGKEMEPINEEDGGGMGLH